MVATQDQLGFGGCTNIGECPRCARRRSRMDTIARLNRDLLRAGRHRRKRG